MGSPLCRHCGRKTISRPRGLCWHCYYSPGVKDLYATDSRYARRGVMNGYHRSNPPLCPTRALPGSAEKLLVIEERVAAGFAPFHPGDFPAEESANG